MSPALLATLAWAVHPLQPVHEKPEAYSEIVTVVADLPGGGVVRLEMSVSNIGPGDDHGGCRLAVHFPGEQAWSEEVALDRSQWSFAPGPPARLVVGPCTIVAGERVRASATFASGSIDVTLDAPMAATAPPHHRLDTPGGAFYDERVLVPWAPVEVDLRRGVEVRRYAGAATVDHYRVTALPQEIAHRWVRFRGLSAGRSVLLEARLPVAREPVAGWIWVEGESAPVPLTSFGLTQQTGSPGGPSAWVALGEAGATRFRITSGPVVRRYAPVEDHGLLTVVLRSVVGNPVSWDFRAVLALEGVEPLAGIFEVMLDER